MKKAFVVFLAAWLLALVALPFLLVTKRHNETMVRAGAKAPFRGEIQMAFPAPDDPQQSRMPTALRSKQYYLVEPSEVRVDPSGIATGDRGLSVEEFHHTLKTGPVTLSSETARTGYKEKTTTTSFIDKGVVLEFSGVFSADSRTPANTYYVTLPIATGHRKLVFGSHGEDATGPIRIFKVRVLPGGVSGTFARWVENSGVIILLCVVGGVGLFIWLIVFAAMREGGRNTAPPPGASQP